jgi:hypothetical protein
MRVSVPRGGEGGIAAGHRAVGGAGDVPPGTLRATPSAASAVKPSGDIEKPALTLPTVVFPWRPAAPGRPIHRRA